MSISQAYADLLPPDAALDLKVRFQEFYAALAERAEPMLHGPERASWKQVLDLEHENLIAALELSVQEGNGHTALRLAGSLWPYWNIRANWQEGLRLIESALSQSEDADSKLKARATLGKGVLMEREAAGSGHAFIKQAQDLAESAHDLSTTAWALSHLAFSALYDLGFQEAVRLAEQGVEVAEAAGDRWVLAAALFRRGGLEGSQGSLDTALSSTSDALEICRELGDLNGQKESLSQLAWIHIALSQRLEARACMEGALQLARVIGDQLGLASMLTRSSWILDTSPGEGFEEALKIIRRYGNPTQIGDALMQVGWPAFFRGDFKRARECFEQFSDLYTGKDPARHANAISSIAWVDFAEGSSAEALQKSRDAVRAMEGTSKYRLAWQKLWHGELAIACGALGEGLEALKEGVTSFQDLKDEASLAQARVALAQGLYEAGEVDEAIAVYEQAVQGPIAPSTAFLGIGRILIDQGRREESASKLRESFERANNRFEGTGVGALEEMALVKLAEGSAEVGAQILGAAAEARIRSGQPVDVVRHGKRHQSIVQKVMDALGPDSYHKEFTAGKQLTMEEAADLCWDR